MERKSYCFSLLVNKLPADMKETCAENEDRAMGKAAKMFHNSYEENNNMKNMVAITIGTSKKSGGIH